MTAPKHAQRDRKWRAANPEKKRESDRKYREANREKRRESSRKYREANREKTRAYAREKNRKYRAANLEKCREKNRKWHASERGRLCNAEYQEYIRGPRVDDLRARCEYVMTEVFHTDAQRRRFALALLNRGYRHSLVRSLLYHRGYDMEHIAPYIEEAA
jgi:hypothetical protein